MPILNSTLTWNGPVIDIAIGVSEPRRQTLLSAGKLVPPLILIRALVDNGASTTHIAVSVIQPLGLTSTGPVPVITPSTGSTPAMFDEYDVSLTILHPELGKVFDLVAILECQPLSSDYQALLGRDILKYCSFHYNGPDETFSFAF